jgi:hypothetical protein
VRADEERVFVRSMDHAAIFQHTKAAGRNLLLDALVPHVLDSAANL